MSSYKTEYSISEDTLHFEEHVRRVIVGLDKITTVPARTFANCFHVRENGSFFKETLHQGRRSSYSYTYTSDEWFGYNVGMVKQDVEYTSKSSETSPVTYREHDELR